MQEVWRRVGGCLLAAGLAWGAASPAAMAQKVSFKDPKDDDNGPGKYTYPTDPVYKSGSFDLTGFTLKAHGDKVDLDVEMAAKLEDPWKTGSGFSVQMVFVFVQTRPLKKPGGAEPATGKPGEKKPPGGGGKEGTGKTPIPELVASATGADQAATGKQSAGTAAGAKTDSPGVGAAGAGTAGAGTAAVGAKAGAGATAAGTKAAAVKPGFTTAPPGLGIQFAPENDWDRCIILSPLPASRVREEVEAKAAAMKDAIVVPARVRGSGHTISATIDRKALGPGDSTAWGYQVVIAGSDAYPAADSLLVRKVRETENQHRFGGGADGACNPNVLDILAGAGHGEDGEVGQQHEMLQYECNSDNTSKKTATLKLVHFEKTVSEPNKQ